MPKPPAKPGSVADFIHAWPDHVQGQLQELRAAILAVVPDAEEGISYGIPVVKRNGKAVVYYGAAAKHTTLHGAGRQLMQEHAELLAGYKLGAGSIQFRHDKPIPVTLVKKLVKLRVQAMQAKARGSSTKSGSNTAKRAAKT